MRVLKYPSERRYDLATNRFSGAVTVEIDGEQHQVQAAHGLDCADAEKHIRAEMAKQPQRSDAPGATWTKTP